MNIQYNLFLIHDNDRVDRGGLLAQDLDLNRIAGNTISVPPVGCVLGVVLAGPWTQLLQWDGQGHAGNQCKLQTAKKGCNGNDTNSDQIYGFHDLLSHDIQIK